jgi:uncharacterized protein
MKPEYLYPNSLNIFITEDCNLNCRYCFVDKTYKKSQLTLPALKRAIDLLFLFPQKTKSIAFNGGEPLLEYPLLKKTCIYIKEKAEQENIKINLATMTNGTLISKKQCQFFEKNRIIVKVSIDGDKRNHDKNRLFKKNSSDSSFQVIIANLNNFNDKSKIAASLVFAPQTISHLFKNIKFLQKLGFGYIEFYPEIFAFWTKNQLDKLKEELRKITDYYISLFAQKKLDLIFKNSLLDAIINKREIVGNSGSCQKIHLAPDENFYFCDKVFSLPEKERKKYIIGNIKNGINNNKRLELLDYFQRKCENLPGRQNNCCFCPIGHYLYFSSHQNQNLKKSFFNFHSVNKVYLDNFLLIKKELQFNPLFANMYRY